MSKPIDIDKLVERLADRLGGELMDGNDVPATGGNDNENPVDKQGTAVKIYSSLPMTNRKFRGIVERFVIRLDEQLSAIDSAWSRRDYDELKKLGHWLKGSAGSVGLEPFVEPAKAFEQFALEKDDVNIEVAISELRSLYQRVAIEHLEDDNQGIGNTEANKEYIIPDKLTCRLLDTNPRLRPIIEKFVSQLSDWLNTMDDAVVKQDFDQIRKFAYWLKGSGGSVGFDAFTEPAVDLESCAKEKQLDVSTYTIGIIRDLNARITLTQVEA